MSGALAMLLGGGGGPVNPLASMSLVDFELSPTDASASVTFHTDGTITYTGNGSSGPANWYLPTTTGIGTSHWVRLTLNSGSSPDAGAVGSALQLSSNRTWTWDRTTSGSDIASITLEVSAAVGMSPIVCSGSGNVEVEEVL